MNEGTKKRVAGTIVLVCLAVIFIPILLDGEGLRSPELRIDVPVAPALPRVSDIQPQRPDFALEREAGQGAETELPPPLEPVPASVEAESVAESTIASGASGDTAAEPTISAPVDIAADAPEIAADAPEVKESDLSDVAPEATSSESIRPDATPGSDVLNNDTADVIASTDNAPTADVERPSLNEQGLPDAWSVRLGTFGNQGNAEALLERLLAQDYKAYIRRFNNSNGILTAVYVGPLLSREQADALRAELQSGFELDGLVEKFTVEP